MSYLQIVQHSEGRHARGRGSEEGLQDGRSAGLVLLLGGHGRRTRARSLEQRLLQERGPEGVSVSDKVCVCVWWGFNVQPL